jgi:hypothetical protein
VGRSLCSMSGDQRRTHDCQTGSRCSATAINIGAQVQHIGADRVREGRVRRQMAGRSMPGSVFNTKRETAIRAPVLPAETRGIGFARVLDQVGGRRASTNPFCRTQRHRPVDRPSSPLRTGVMNPTGALPNSLDRFIDFQFRFNSHHADPPGQSLMSIGLSDAGIQLTAGRLDRYMGTVVAPHGINGDSYRHRMTNQPRQTMDVKDALTHRAQAGRFQRKSEYYSALACSALYGHDKSRSGEIW